MRINGVKVEFDQHRMLADFSERINPVLVAGCLPCNTSPCHKDYSPCCYKHEADCICKRVVLRCEMVVCDDCGGRGTTTRHIECDGGGFTSSEWSEMCDGDPDFAEDYMSGVYDRDCETCNGRNVMAVPCDDNDPELLKALDAYVYEEACYRAEVAEERRMGA